jgi:RNA polymerase sigma-70 factor (sigma-E family)
VTFDELVRLRLPSLLRFAVVLTGDRTVAEDVVQDVLLKARGRWQRIVALELPEAYVRRMVVNELVSFRRRWWRLIPSPAVPARRATVADHAASIVDRQVLRDLLARLPPRQRAVLVLRSYEGLSDHEIAHLLGCRAVTVRGYAARALAALRISAGPADRWPPSDGTQHATQRSIR